MSVTNYAIIDHAGQVGAFKALYQRAFNAASKFEEVYTMKKVCQLYSPYAREITDKMKYFHRYNRTPKKVFLVCASQLEPKAQFIANIWETRNIPVVFIEENPAPTTSYDTISPYRRCALLWANAVGWQFSAPLVRDPRTEEIDMFTKRPDMAAEFGSYAAKRTTTPQKYVERFRAVASEAECIEFTKHMQYLKKNNLITDEYLDPDWHICPECKRPVRISADTCPYCDHNFEEVEETETFYDDSFREECPFDLD